MSTLHVENLKGLSSGGNANKIIVPSGQELHAAGHVIQVATDRDTTTLTMSSDINYHDTGLSITFTPKSSNRIIVIHCMMGGEVSSSSNIGIGFKVFRDSTEIYNNDYAIYNSSNNAQRIDQVPILLTETSGSTSARTYKVQASRRAGSGTAKVNNYGESCMTLMEIAQ